MLGGSRVAAQLVASALVLSSIEVISLAIIKSFIEKQSQIVMNLNAAFSFY
jgi:hypothetical protein